MQQVGVSYVCRLCACAPLLWGIEDSEGARRMVKVGREAERLRERHGHCKQIVCVCARARACMRT